MLTAVTAATLDEVCGGRFVLGIGPGSPTVLERQGIRFDQPLARLRETVEVVRRLLRGEEVSFTGKTMQVAGAQLDFTPMRPAIPIYFGVTGPKALALAGEIADGVILNGFVSLEYTKRAVEIVRSSARASGRDPDEIEIAASILVSVDTNTTGGTRCRSTSRRTLSGRVPECRPRIGDSCGCAQSHRCGSSPRGVPGCSANSSPTRSLPTLHAQEQSPRCKKASRAVGGRREAADCQLRTEQHGVLARATGPVTGWDARYSMLPDLMRGPIPRDAPSQWR